MIKGNLCEQIPLKPFISKMLDKFQPIIVRKNSFFINDVRDDFEINTNIHLLKSVLSGMFETIIDKCQDASVRITAKNYNDVVLFRISNLSGFKGFDLIQELEHVNNLAQKIGGCITYNDQRIRESTFVLSFYSRLAA